MDYSPKLQKQRPCSCVAVLDVGSWCNSWRKDGGFRRRFSDDYYQDQEDYAFDDQMAYYPSSSSRSSTLGTRWRGLWRRVVKEKRKMMMMNSGGRMQQVPNYDPYTYAQNFDQGSAWIEPDNLTRSFSARFAVPSTILQRVA